TNELKRQLENQGKDFTQFNTDRSTFATRLGGILTTAYRLNDKNTVSLRAFVNRSSADETRHETGVDPQDNFLDQAMLRYVHHEASRNRLVVGSRGQDQVRRRVQRPPATVLAAPHPVLGRWCRHQYDAAARRDLRAEELRARRRRSDGDHAAERQIPRFPRH